MSEKKTQSIKEARKKQMLRQTASRQKTTESRRSAPRQKTAESQHSAPSQNTAESRRSAPRQKTAESQHSAPSQNTAESRRSAPRQKTVEIQRSAPSQKTAKPQRSAPNQKTVEIQRSAPSQNTVKPQRMTPGQNNVKSQRMTPDQNAVRSQRPAPSQKTAKPRKASALQSKVTENYRRRKRRAKRERRIIAVLVALVTMYSVAVFSEIPVIAKWRTIYIETAMTTKSHQWLAEYFIPGFIIDKVMARTHDALDAQEDLISNWSESIRNNSRGKFITQSKLDAFYSTYWELDTESVRKYIDEHYEIENGGYDNILIEDFDSELGLLTPSGDPVLVVDTANNLIIIDVSQGDYHGKLAVVKDPSQVNVAKSKNFGSFGQEVAEFGEENGAILAINASRFRDIGGHGNGGTVKGSLVLDGQEYGSPQKGYWRFAGFKQDNLLNICSYPKKEIKDYRWGVEVYPALIVNGKNVIDNTLGMGIQPRTAIGQSASGDFMLLVIDGRQVGYSLGCTVADCAEVLTEYHAYQGMNLDGGSSTVMWYKGELITRPCSVSGRGRYMPDAVLVMPAQKDN